MTDGPASTPSRGAAPSPIPQPKSTRPRIRAPRDPNYAARRMMFSTLAITAAVGVGVAAWMLTRNEPDTVVAVGGDWDAAVLIDRTTGALITVDKEGTTDETQPGNGRVAAVYSQGDRLALVGTDQIVLTA